MKNQQKGFVVPLLVLLAVIVIGGGVYYYSTVKPKPTSYVNAALTNEYKVLVDESLWNTKLVKTDNPESWTIPEKNTTVKVVDTQNNFYCGDKKAIFEKYSSYNSGAVGGWNGVYIVDCGTYYFVYEYGDAGPKLFGPFDGSGTPNVVRTADGTVATIPGQGASQIEEKDHIKVISPNGGENLQVGSAVTIQWTNYKSQEPLTIALQSTDSSGQTSSKIVAFNVPASLTSYKWTVTSEDRNSKYKIEVYPAGGRNYIGRSKDFFKIIGEQLIIINSPLPNARVNINNPLVISGKAKKVFGEGEFDISASYILDGRKQVVTSGIASCNLTGNGCDWTSGNFVDFKSTLDLSKSPVCYLSLEFYKRNDKTGYGQAFYIIPLWLYGNSNCQ